MKKLALVLAGALLPAPFFPALAAPDAPATATTPADAPVDPAVSALLAKSIAAYAKLQGLSMDFAVSDKTGDKVSASSGTLAFARPDQAKIEGKADGEPLIIQTDGTKVINQSGSKTYRATPLSTSARAMYAVLSSFPSAMQVVLPSLMTGKSPLELKMSGNLRWEKIALLPDNGVTMTLPAASQLTLKMYFDPTDNLLRRVEATRTTQGGENLNITTFSNPQIDPQFAPAAFTYTPAAGITEYVAPPSYDPKLIVGAKPYALTGLDLGGKPVDWSAYKGKVVLLDFWATWCGPCIGELPNVLTNYGKYHDKGFEIVGVSLDEDKKALTDFVAARKMPWPQLFDAKGWKNVNSTAYGVRAIPFTLLIGKDGTIAAVNPRGEELEPALKKAMGM